MSIYVFIIFHETVPEVQRLPLLPTSAETSPLPHYNNNIVSIALQQQLQVHQFIKVYPEIVGTDNSRTSSIWLSSFLGNPTFIQK